LSKGICTVDIDVTNKKLKISDYKIKHFKPSAKWSYVISEILKEANWIAKTE
jgi:hypothetical protein